MNGGAVGRRVACPRCKGGNVRRSRRRNWLERAVGVVGGRMYCCRSCKERFLDFRLRVGEKVVWWLGLLAVLLLVVGMLVRWAYESGGGVPEG